MTTRPEHSGATRKAILLFFFFFCVISAFWVMKPVRTSSVVKAFGEDYYPLVKQGSLLIIPLFLFFYYTMTCYLTRPRLIQLFASIFCVGSVIFWVLFTVAPTNITKVCFFYYVDIYVTAMVTLFWTYLNSVYEPSQAKKYYGVIGSGGIIGGIVGSSIAGWLSEALGDHILLVSAGFLLPIFVIIPFLERGSADKVGSNPVCADPSKSGWESYTEGIRSVFESRYLLAIVAVIATYEIVSSVIDYQFNASASAAYSDRLAMQAFQGRVFGIGNALSAAIMLLLTPWVHKRLGMLAGLMFLPVALALGSVTFAIFPALMAITLMTTGEMAFAYSIHQASKEILYTPLDDVSKFKAKAFIDMFVFRFAKTIGSLLTFGYAVWAKPHGLSSQWLMVVNLGLIGLWLYSIRFAAREFEKKVASDKPNPVIRPLKRTA